MRELLKTKKLESGARRSFSSRLLICAGALALVLFAGGRLRAEDLSPREAAKAQFEKAEMERAALEAKPEIARSLKDYTSLVSAYRRVYLTSPLAVDDPAAIDEVAGLYRKMGDLFDEKYYRSAVETYQFLLHDYPDSRYREDALLTIAHIQQENLRDPDAARSSYQEFLALHPHSSHTAEVRALIAKLKEQPSAPPAAKAAATRQEKSSAESAASNSTQPLKPSASEIASAAASSQKDLDADDVSAEDSHDESGSTGKSHGEVTSIRTWNADTYTRVVIDVGTQVKYQASRIPNPDRIFFDLDDTGLTSSLLHKTVQVPNGGFVKDVRVARNQENMIRVVLDVDNAKDYSVFFLPDPDRLIVDVYGDTGNKTLDAAGKKENPPGAQAAANAQTSANDAGKPAQTPEAAKKKENPSSAPAATANASLATSAKQAIVAKNETPATAAQETAKTSAPPLGDKATGVRSPFETPLAGSARQGASSSPASANSSPSTAKSGKPSNGSLTSTHQEMAELQPPSVPEPTHNGEQSLSRALGLKIGRIVIDPGHGGHDTGTIGPTGLMEKDLCLDVALRLGKLIAQRLPGAEVVYTRDDDTFIPLEQRTEIANEAHADLFLSIHANSSPSRSARGVETYYLNLNGSSSAMAVAARENALSDSSEHDLQDLVAKIARTEKIAESRDFASDIQDSLSKRMDSLRGEPNRGVRKAPFVVLIGANMPSVLAEISFLSNPGDEQWLKKPENRQRVAEGLYQGIESYLHSTNSLSVDKNPSAAHLAAGNPSAANRTGIEVRSTRASE